MKNSPLLIFICLLLINLILYFILKVPWIFQTITLFFPILFLSGYYYNKVEKILKKENKKKYLDNSIEFKITGLDFINPFTLLSEELSNESYELKKVIKYYKLYLLYFILSFIWLIIGNIITTI